MDARFVRACRSTDEMPPEGLVELAVVGRSNCGKSSLINAMSGRKKLARTSSTPGRTRQLCYFRVQFSAEPFHLVDLPGYGYAKVSKTERAAWDELITAYIEGSPYLRGLLLLVDIRRSITDDERSLLEWCERRELMALVALTKADKLAKNRRFAAAAAARRALELEEMPLLTSSTTSLGVSELRGAVAQLLFGEEV
ncbi:MAG: YihA family ribosome biogenesis GTP-binding protein [Proteobacteria bacterium]|nr:MAG: YihA family ribosome biogenesis GTP-binding protein [Pseudomonadota bacterium]PIE18927.1 MAG: YihA family ribosome biogenesis GTP-binding protein [Pseudomonadota bacterium]